MVKNNMKANYIYELTIDGMMCGMCEAHVNDFIRRNFPIKKVKSSARKNLTTITSEVPLDENELITKIGSTGYIVKNVTCK